MLSTGAGLGAVSSSVGSVAKGMADKGMGRSASDRESGALNKFLKILLWTTALAPLGPLAMAVSAPMTAKMFWDMAQSGGSPTGPTPTAPGNTERILPEQTAEPAATPTPAPATTQTTKAEPAGQSYEGSQGERDLAMRRQAAMSAGGIVATNPLGLHTAAPTKKKLLLGA